MDKNILNNASNISKLHVKLKKIEWILSNIEKIAKANSGGYIRIYPNDLLPGKITQLLYKDFAEFISLEFDNKILSAISETLELEKNNIECLLSTMLSNIPTDKPTK